MVVSRDYVYGYSRGTIFQLIPISVGEEGRFQMGILITSGVTGLESNYYLLKIAKQSFLLMRKVKFPQICAKMPRCDQMSD